MRSLKTVPAILLLALFACGIGEISISIAPRTAQLNANDQMQFAATVGSAGNKTVLWTATSGTVTSNGLFTAPALAGTCYVTAISEADRSKIATATVEVIAPVVVTPNQLTLAPGATQTFTAMVAATGSTAVTWSIQEGASGGTITSTGDYTAPATTGLYHVIATSVADPTLKGIALVSVTPLT